MTPPKSLDELNELASLAEVATILGVPKRTAARYVDRADFPTPIDELDVGRIWRIQDVKRWGDATLTADGRLPTGRPPRPKP